jgi:hypothetical protein
MSVHVRIDRLIIDSNLLDGSSPRKVQRAIEQALGAQLAMPGAAAGLSSLGHQEAMPPRALPGGSAPLGARVGTALSHALGVATAKGASRG